ncbi:MAG: caspase family protein [Acidobacteria bacterium]|nr:caspase family protein [Acidobacteriota bacterium]
MLRLAVMAGSIALIARAQSCPQLGLRTVDEAESQFFQRKSAAARLYLEKAARQCGQDGAVHRRIADLYRAMGDDAAAQRHDKMANFTGARPDKEILGSSKEEGGIESLGPVRRKYALVVGVSKFKDFSAQNRALKAGEPRFQRLPDLEFAAKDARDFSSALLDPAIGKFRPERVSILTNEQVTYTNIRQALARLEAEATEDDLVLLYFSGHGSSPEMDPAAAAARSGFILMHDTEVRDVLNTATAFPMDDLQRAISRFRAKRVIAFLDTCYSGDASRSGARDLAGPRGSRGLAMANDTAERIVQNVPQGRARVVITSSNASERSWESETIRNGYFTSTLIQALQLDNGRPTISQIYRHLNDKVPTIVEREKFGAQQHPQIRTFPPGQREIDLTIGAPETDKD